MLRKYLPVHGKFKFCFLELSVIFFLNIFDPWLFELANEEPVDREGRLYNTIHLFLPCRVQNDFQEAGTFLNMKTFLVPHCYQQQRYSSETLMLRESNKNVPFFPT